MNKYSFTLDRDSIIARSLAMSFIKNYVFYNENRLFKFNYIWKCYQLWLNEQYLDNVNRIISTTEFMELLEFRFDNCKDNSGKYKLEISNLHN